MNYAGQLTPLVLHAFFALALLLVLAYVASQYARSDVMISSIAIDAFL